MGGETASRLLFLTETKPMTIQRISSPEVTEPAPGTWSNCLKVGDTVYVAGLTARDRNLQPAGGDQMLDPLEDQASLVVLVTAAGGTMRDVVKLNIYVTQIANRDQVWRARREFFEGAFPVATLVEVSALAQAAILVEIEAVAVLGHGGRPS